MYLFVKFGIEVAHDTTFAGVVKERQSRCELGREKRGSAGRRAGAGSGSIAYNARFRWPAAGMGDGCHSPS
ncbi:MAG: hypothetical protein Kow001_23250 [Acidobacteriota bacterium]